ncbi:MAG TPA: hypothetical protein VIS73_08515 [Rhodocyclaceae bacterium]
MAQDDSQFRGGPQIRVVSIPGGWFGKLLALLLAAAIGVLALTFSLAILAVVFVIGLVIWAYFLIRRALLGSPSASRSQQASRTRRQAPDGEPGGRVIEGEVLGRDDADRQTGPGKRD